MADPLSFRPPRRISPNLILNHAPYSAHETFGTQDAKYFRSVSEQLVSAMRNWRCKRCNRVFASEKGQIPWMAYCGHFIHKRCHLYSDSEGQEPSYFECGQCGSGTPAARAAEPLLDSVIEDFFTRLLERGIRCNPLKCGKLHARYNIFKCIEYNPNDRPPYFCVWCATKDKDVVNKLKTIEKRILPNREGVADYDAQLRSPLSTLDRTHSMHLNQCCLCRDTLCDTKRTSDKVYIAHLPCKHVCHLGCSDKGTDREETIKCNFCGTLNKSSEKQERIWHSKDYLNYNQDDKFYVCDYCQQSHPPSNFIRATIWRLFIFPRQSDTGVCVWCTVEKKEHERSKKKKNDDREEMERCNRELNNEGTKAKK